MLGHVFKGKKKKGKGGWKWTPGILDFGFVSVSFTLAHVPHLTLPTSPSHPLRVKAQKYATVLSLPLFPGRAKPHRPGSESASFPLKHASGPPCRAEAEAVMLMSTACPALLSYVPLTSLAPIPPLFKTKVHISTPKINTEITWCLYLLLAAVWPHW